MHFLIWRPELSSLILIQIIKDKLWFPLCKLSFSLSKISQLALDFFELPQLRPSLIWQEQKLMEQGHRTKCASGHVHLADGTVKRTYVCSSAQVHSLAKFFTWKLPSHKFLFLLTKINIIFFCSCCCLLYIYISICTHTHIYRYTLL